MKFQMFQRKKISLFLIMFIGFSSVAFADGQIRYGKNVYYKGSVSPDNIPHGKGKLVTDYEVTDNIGGKTKVVTNKDILEGVFENGTVTEAKLVLGRYNGPLWINAFVFKGTVEYSVSDDGKSVTYTMIDGIIKDCKFCEYSVTPDNTLSVIRRPKSVGCDLESGRIRVTRNGNTALYVLNNNFSLVDINELSDNPSYREQQGYRLIKEKFVLDMDTTTSEGKYLAAIKIRSTKNLPGWSDDDYQQLYASGFKLLIESAEGGYTPAQIILWKLLIFNNKPNEQLDKLALKYAENVAEGTGEEAIDALLYLQKNYLVGSNNINNSYRYPQTSEGTARYVGPKNLKKSRLYLEKILANESALQYFIREEGGYERKGAELELNDLNKAIGDRPYKDYAAEISKKILGTWKMVVYDGITSIYTFRSDGTFKATHTYAYPEISSDITIKFDVTGKWCVNKDKDIEISDYDRFQNIKASCTCNHYEHKNIVNILNARGDDKYDILFHLIRQASGNLNYIGWANNNYFSNLEFSDGQVKASYAAYGVSHKTTLTKVSTQAKKPVPKRR